ncbi:MAG: hypothetical protein CSB55_05490 [Candidatus Cloacimonadota bacterium]|nr:MAG: hypothetical protein CSB55_05490 [Candidatus Cloacimonadota bacterium]
MSGFYSEYTDLTSGTVNIKGEEAHHILNVFRKKNGDTVQVTNGKGLLISAQIIATNKKEVICKILKSEKKLKSKPIIACAFSLLRSKHDFMIIEKLTELGISEFYPFISQFTVRKPNSNTAEKMTKTAISAIKQCDNAYLPKIYEPRKLTEQIKFIKSKQYKIITASELQPENTLADCWDKKENLCFAIGPEGGFSPEEREFFTRENISQITLGNHILRAETAAVNFASVILGKLLENDPSHY